MDEAAIRDRLRTVEDSLLGDNIVALGLVNDIQITETTVEVSLALGAPYSPVESTIGKAVREALDDLDREVSLIATIPDSTTAVLPNVENVIAVASGKGGVGKSTVATNLAAGLAKLGADVGIFDTDIYGPNVPTMFGGTDTPEVTDDETIVPPTVDGIRMMSMAYLVSEDDPVIWRGPMVHNILTQLLEDVEWGQLDYLILDLPPGTGDTQLTVLQTVPVTGAVIVTTPQTVALADARRGLEMFANHETPVVGVIENMSTFVCPDCGSEHPIFEAGGGREFADEYEVPFLGAIPLDPAVRTGTDDGRPIVNNGDSQAGQAFRTITEAVADGIGVIRRRAHVKNQ